MPWTAPKTWATNEILTSPNMNTHVRDNFNWVANDHPRVEARRAATQAITSATVTAIQFSEADIYDHGPMHDPSSNNTRLTVPSGGGGLYLVGGQVGWEANNTGIRDLAIRVNGAGTNAILRRDTAIQNTNTFQDVVWLLVLNATDYVELTVAQNSGVSLTASACMFFATWVAFA